MKIKNADAPVTNKIFWQGINAILDLLEKFERKNQEEHKGIEERLEGKMENGFAKLEKKIDNLAANTPTNQRVEKIEKDIKKLQTKYEN